MPLRALRVPAAQCLPWVPTANRNDFSQRVPSGAAAVGNPSALVLLRNRYGVFRMQPAAIDLDGAGQSGKRVNMVLCISKPIFDFLSFFDS